MKTRAQQVTCRGTRSLYAAIALTALSACGAENVNFNGVPRPPAISQDEDANAIISRSFVAGEVQTAEYKIDTGFGLIRQEFSLQQKPKTELNLTQVERAVITDAFTQGHDGDQQTEQFSISEAGLFDLLIVIDDSSSMAAYQDRLADSLPSILRYISNTNWQLAVATTTSSCLNETNGGTRILTRAQYEADPVAAQAEFRELIRIGEGGNSTERGILMGTKALRGECGNSTNPWLRSDSSRAMLLVTDEHNCGSASNEGCVGEAYASAQYFFDNAPDNVTVNALLLLEEPPFADPGNPNDPNHDCQGSGGYEDLPNPSEYLQLVSTTGGIVSDVCRSDYTTVLEQMSQDVKDKINAQFELAYQPVNGSVSASIDGVLVSDLTVNGRTLTIRDTIANTAETLEVNYNHDPISRKKIYALSQTPDPSTINVKINGQAVKDNSFSFDSYMNELEFRQMPADRSQIQVEYRKNDPLESDFNIAESFLEDSVEVLVNGKKEKDFQIGSSKVKFNKAPKDRAKIQIRYAKPGDKTTDYQAAELDLEKLEEVKVFDRETGQELAAIVKNGKLQIDEKDVSPDRPVVAEYDLFHAEEERQFSIPLQSNLFTDSIEIETEQGTCNSDIDLDSKQLSFQCEDDSMEEIVVRYQYATDYSNVFPMDLDYEGPKRWAVYVDDKPIDSFHIFGDTVVILKDKLPAGAKVRIDVDISSQGNQEQEPEQDSATN